MHEEYVAGFFDGEGSIGLYPQRSHTKTGWKFQPQLCIVQSGEVSSLDDKLDEFFDSYDIQYNKNIREDNTRHGWRVQRREDIVKLWEILKDNLTVKYREFEIMAEEIIPMLIDGVHLTKSGILEVMEAKERMDETKSCQSHNERKYDLQYFENEFGETF